MKTGTSGHILLMLALATLMAAGGIVSAATTTGEDVALRFAVLGDAEPKPEPEFPNLAAAVDDINDLAEQQRIDFVAGIGDIPHDGTMVQYRNVTPELQRLTLPFYPIMGNEEHTSTEERFLTFATRWNEGDPAIDSTRYVLDTEEVALIFASPDHGRDFDDEGVDWILTKLEEAAPKPALLFVHGAPTGIYPENPDKGITHERFGTVTEQPNLAAVISGDLHMDMDRTNHSKRVDGVHYLHIPPLERTKIPDESRHNPMFRVFAVTRDGHVEVTTYQVGLDAPLERHDYRFELPAGNPE
ncbi:metallophosphoesterase family protein [Vreelandella utahensis]|uniref:metallophosphoesterase family protein n=1 Tax=Vreelandella halophila TaxID=86177 RepID=UPI000986101B|nr:metallophosphoesterase [Halomonas utahensis]